VIVLGIDPGSVVTGYGIVACRKRKSRLIASGCLRPARGLPFERRLLHIHDEVSELITHYVPDQAAIEAVFFGANVQTLMKMCHARGTILMALARAGLPIFEYSPREIKKSVVGNGNASKEQVQFMVHKLFDMVEGSAFDESDGIATALCHANRQSPAVADPNAGSSAAAQIQALREQDEGRSSFAEKLIEAGADPTSAARPGRGGRSR